MKKGFFFALFLSLFLSLHFTPSLTLAQGDTGQSDEIDEDEEFLSDFDEDDEE